MSDEKPDPSEVDPIDQDEHRHQRDENGDLIPVPEVVKIEGEWQRVEHIPPVKGFIARVDRKFSGRGEVDMDEIDELMSEFYSDPDVEPEEWDDYDGGFYLPLMNHMATVCSDGLDDQTTEALQQKIEERQSEGN